MNYLCAKLLIVFCLKESCSFDSKDCLRMIKEICIIIMEIIGAYEALVFNGKGSKDNLISKNTK